VNKKNRRWTTVNTKGTPSSNYLSYRIISPWNKFASEEYERIIREESEREEDEDVYNF
jgi:hypothetical protein